MKRFGDKLRTLRTTRGLTQRELAAALGYQTSGYLSEVENSKKQPTAELVLKVSDYFGVSADVLLRDELEVEAREGQ